jgi:SAM-dependent methyltransferase
MAVPQSGANTSPGPSLAVIQSCRSCGGSDLPFVLGLGETPLANALPEAGSTAPEPAYPLEVVLCRACSLLQLTVTVPPAQLFSDYIYFSSFSDTMLQHAKTSALELIEERRLGASSLVVEIASNDGYLLRNFVDRGVPVLGVEPARNIARVARERGVATVEEFFGEDLVDRLFAEGRPHADVILANNVMAHVPAVNGVVAGVARLLAPGGVFVMETPYVKDLLDNVEFDTIYHEHVFYYSLTALDHLFRRHGLAVVDVRWLPIHGGTIRVRGVLAQGAQPSAAVRELLEREAEWGVAAPGRYEEFARRVGALRQELRALISEIKGSGKRIAAYGAAAKGSTLLNYMGLGTDVIDYVVDRSTHKQGRLMPGSRLPISPPERLVQDLPEYTLLLSWNLADEVLRQQQEYRNLGGRFIIPVPSVRVT